MAAQLKVVVRPNRGKVLYVLHLQAPQSITQLQAKESLWQQIVSSSHYGILYMSHHNTALLGRHQQRRYHEQGADDAYAAAHEAAFPAGSVEL